MIDRFTRIHTEFGWGASARLVLMIVGLIGMSLLGVFAFGSWWPTIIAIIGIVLGFVLKRQIVDAFEWTTWALPIASVIYGVLLFVGERMGLSREVQLMLITLTTVVVLDLQFWSLSDPSIVKVEEKR